VGAYTLLDEFLTADVPERVVFEHLDAMIAARRKAVRQDARPPRRRPGERLNLLLVGYTGAGNLGSDMRVAEMIRQFRVILGDEADMTVTTLGQSLPGDGFAGVRKAPVAVYMPEFLLARCPQAHAVIATEGSMFTSTFSDLLALMMIGALGLAVAGEAVSVAYGADAGPMSPELRDFVVRNCAGAVVVCRNDCAQATLQRLDLRAEPGADPAWTFEPRSAEQGSELLRAAGWDGQLPVIAVCPVNPFWWPVRADLDKARELAETGAHTHLHHDWVLFHHDSDVAAHRYGAYIGALGEALTAYRRERACFPVIVGMDRGDRRACVDLARRLPFEAPVYASGERTLDDVVGILRQSDLVVSSRYHAIVASMPALVPAVGISTDARIVGALSDLGRPDLCIDAGAPDLAARALDRMLAASREREAVAELEAVEVARQLRLLGLGGIALADEFRRAYPDLACPVRSWEAHLPPLGSQLTALLEKHT
jgi:polysaccharide pyruvyl transferase WcaK-like protein